MELILTPPIAFMVNIGLVAILFGFGRLLAPTSKPTKDGKTKIYAGGEEAVTSKAAPGYRRFFIVALFFAVLHLGALVLATAGLAGGAVLIGSGFWVALLLYLVGLSITLLMLLVS